MNPLTFKNGQVDPKSLTFNHTHNDPVNSYIESASWVNGKDLTEWEMDELNGVFPDLAYEDFIEHQIARAEYAADLAMDR